MSTALLDFDVNEESLAINSVEIDNEEYILENNEMINPFFVNISGGNLKKADIKDIYKTYPRVLALVLKNNFNQQSLSGLFSRVVTKTEFDKFAPELVLVEATRHILKNNLHFDRSSKIMKEFLTNFNHNNIVLNNDEIVIPLFELTESDVHKYFELYEHGYDLDHYINVLLLAKSFNWSGHKYHKQMSNILHNLQEADFWSNNSNCQVNMSDAFLERAFKYHDEHSNNVLASVRSKQVDDIHTKLETQLTKNPLINKQYGKGSDYLQNINKKQEHVDAGVALKYAKKRTYYVKDFKKNNILREKITELFKVLNVTTNEKELYDLFNALLVSKEYCHIVLNNPEILDKMSPLIEKFMPLYRYLFGYAWVCFYLEEGIFKTKASPEHRHVFDINTANKLPFFPYCMDDIHLNPYLCSLVSNKALDISSNCMALQMISDYKDYGIDNLAGFRLKFNVFTTGKADKNIFDGIDWKHCAISGSIVPACCQKRTPLLDLVTQAGQSVEEQWATFFNHYYSDSDVDLMCNKSSLFDFIDFVHSNILHNIKKNLVSLRGENAAKSVEVETVKSSGIVVSKQYIEEQIEEIRDHVGKDKYTIADVITNIKSSEIKEYFHEKYYSHKMKQNRKLRQEGRSKTNELYDDYFKPATVDEMNISIVDYEISKDSYDERDGDTCYYVNDFRTEANKVGADKNFMILKISESLRFKIKSEYLLHNVEVFRTKTDEFFSCVANFHLPCVRAYYNGENVFMLPSCVTALMTNINIDYKYFAGVRDPIEILNKYRVRGFGTLINEQEKLRMIEYNSVENKWNGMFSVDPKNKDKVKKLLGSKTINDEMFKPGKYMKGFPDDVYKKLNKRSVVTIAELKENYNEKYKYHPAVLGLDLFKLKTINEDGSIRPLQKWPAEALYYLISGQ